MPGGTNVKLIDPLTGLPYRAGGSAASTGGQNVSTAPSPDATNGLTPVVAGAGGSSLVVKAAPGNLYAASLVAGATAGFLIAYNSITAPSGGAALTANLVLWVVPVAANGLASLGGSIVPDRFSVGITLLFSTATTTYTIPASVALHIRGTAA